MSWPGTPGTPTSSGRPSTAPPCMSCSPRWRAGRSQAGSGRGSPVSGAATDNWDLPGPIWQTAEMSSTKHREGARLDRVPLPVEAARVAVTGWEGTRTAARVLTALPGKGPLQQKVIKQLPQTFADLGPTYVKFGQIVASSPGAFGDSRPRESRGLLDRVPSANTDEVHKLVEDELGAPPSELFATFEEEPFASASIAQVHYATLRTG